MSSFVIKCIACITMFLDHIKYSNPIFQNFLTEYFGRLSFPLFAFLLTESYRNTSDLKKYVGRLLVFAVLSEIPFNLVMGSRVFYPIHQNVLWTFLIGIFCIYIGHFEENVGFMHKFVFAFHVL